MKVGLVTGSVTPRPRARPWVKVVLPGPEVPDQEQEVARGQDAGQGGGQSTGLLG